MQGASQAQSTVHLCNVYAWQQAAGLVVHLQFGVAVEAATEKEVEVLVLGDYGMVVLQLLQGRVCSESLLPSLRLVAQTCFVQL